MCLVWPREEDGGVCLRARQVCGAQGPEQSSSKTRVSSQPLIVVSIDLIYCINSISTCQIKHGVGF